MLTPRTLDSFVYHFSSIIKQRSFFKGFSLIFMQPSQNMHIKDADLNSIKITKQVTGNRHARTPIIYSLCLSHCPCFPFKLLSSVQFQPFSVLLMFCQILNLKKQLVLKEFVIHLQSLHHSFTGFIMYETEMAKECQQILFAA